MTSKHDTGVYNVEASLFAWLAAGVAANAATLAATAPVLQDTPEEPLSSPCYAVHFIGDMEDDAPFQGRHVGGNLEGSVMTGLLQVTCYATRRNANWRAQLNQMLDAVRKTYYGTDSSAVIIKDFYTNADAPTDTAYRITLINIYRAPEPLIANPDIEQRGLIIMYRWIERA